MTDKKYQTIDPLILQTLNLNQKRIHHIFDILHGRDLKVQTNRTPRSATINVLNSSKLPKLQQKRQQTKSPRNKIQSSRELRKSRQSSTASLIQHQQNKSVVNLSNIEQQYQMNSKANKVFSSRNNPKIKIKSNLPSARMHTKSQIQGPEISPSPTFMNPAQKRQRLTQDYGLVDNRRNKSMQINPKDVYRLEIQHLISRPTQIQQLQDAQKLMVRLKNRYQHLRKFDKQYYLNLTKNQLLML